MGRATFQWLGEIEIIAVFRCFFLFSFHYFGTNLCLAAELITYRVAGTFVLVHLLCNDVTGAFQGIFHIFHVSFHEGGSLGTKIVFPLQHQDGGKRFQPFLAGYFSTCLPLGFIRKINVFQFRRIPGVVDTFLQFGSQFSLLVDGAENRFFPFGYVAQLIVLLFYLLYLHFIQSAGSFFTVTTDEGNRSTFTQKMERTTYLSFRYTQKTGNHLVK